MKRTLFFLWTILLSFNNLAQELPNNSFENWEVDQFNDLLYYLDSGEMGIHNITKSTDATDGDFSIKLETVINNGDLEPGFFVNFNPDDMSGGASYSEYVASIRFQYKVHVVAQDSALFLAYFKKDGDFISDKLIKFSANENTDTWTTYQFDTDIPSTVIPDTVLIGASSSNAIDEIGMEEGSWIQIDNIEFLDTSGNVITPVANHSFEDWQTINIEKPEDFQTSLEWWINSDPLSVEKTTDATDGDFAIKLNNIIDDEGEVIPGTVTNGDINSEWPFSGGMTLSEIPVSISYDIKTHRENNDEGGFSIIIKDDTGNVIYENSNTYTTDVTNYTTNEITIDVNNDAKTLLINIWNGNTVGSTMQVDNIVLHYTVGINEFVAVEELKAFPVPAKDQLYFAITAQKQLPLSLRILDINGRVVKTQDYELTAGNNQIKISLGKLSKGVYLYQIETLGQTLTKQFLID